MDYCRSPYIYDAGDRLRRVTYHAHRNPQVQQGGKSMVMGAPISKYVPT